MPVCKVLAATLKIQLQQLSHSNVLPVVPGLRGDSVLGQVGCLLLGIVSK